MKKLLKEKVEEEDSDDEEAPMQRPKRAQPAVGRSRLPACVLLLKFPCFSTVNCNYSPFELECF